MARPAQPLPIRLTHWANLVLLAIMAGSGLQILVAFPQLGEQSRPTAGTRSRDSPRRR